MKRSFDWLINQIEKPNMAADMDDKELNLIGDKCRTGYDIDEASRSEWRKQTEDGLKIAKQVVEKKTYPWPNAANVKHPLIAISAIQFAARAYPEIVKGPNVVKTRVLGADPQGLKMARSLRVSKHMSWQCLDQIVEWDPDTDVLLHGLPIMGNYFRKSYWSPLYQRIRKDLISPLDLVVNMKSRNLETARRVSHNIYLYKNEVIERERAGLFVEGISSQMRETDEKEQELFPEQHCWLDLDGDGYEEPYIVTFHYDSGRVARIVPRFDELGVSVNAKGKISLIEPTEYFTKYTFIPSPDNTFYDLGFAHLLGPMNESISTIINQLLDAGSLANLPSGFIGRGIRWQGGRLSFTPGEWKPVDVTGAVLKDNIVPLPTKEPSNVLFQLLGLLNESGMKLASVSETMTGESPSQNTPATTTLALIEQGLKVFTAIYKRIYRSLKHEFRLQFILNSKNLQDEEYFEVLDEQNLVARNDYSVKDLDVSPVADPNMSSETSRMMKGQAIFQTLEVNPTIKGKIEILKRYYEAIDVPNPELLLPADEINKMLNAPPPPNPDMMKIQLEIAKEQREGEMEEHRYKLEELKIMAEIELIKAQAMKAIADAEAAEFGSQFEQYQQQLDSAMQSHLHKVQLLKTQMGIQEKEDKASEKGESDEPSDNSGSGEADTGGMAELSNDQGGAVVPPQDTSSLPNGADRRINIESKLSGSNGNADYAALGQDIRSEYLAGDRSGG